MSKEYDKIGSKIKSSTKIESNGFIKIEATFDDGETREWSEHKFAKSASRPPRWLHYVNTGKINKVISENETESNNVNE